MRRTPIALTAGLIFAGLLVAAYFATNLLGGPLTFLYRNAAAFSEARSLTQLAALAAAAGLLAVSLIVALPLALRPAPFARKLLNVLPIWLIGLTLAGVGMNLAGLGVTATLNLGIVQMNFAQAWVAVSGLLALIAIGAAVAGASFSAATIKAGTLALGITALPALATTAGVLATVAIVMTTTPRVPGFGGGGDFPGAQTRAGGQVQGTPGAQNRPGAQGTPGAQNRPGGQTQGTSGAQVPGGDGGRAGQAGPGGGAGGPPGVGPFGAGGIAALTTRYEVGGGLTALFGILAIVGGLAGVVALRRKRALPALATVSVVMFLAIQLVPVAHANPPVTAQIPWDSPQTEQLWNRACANCHSNATVWPAYSYIAPSSWLNAIDVNDARSMFNISELDKVPAFIKRQYPENAAERLRDGSMPPADYRMLHPEAHLTDAEKDLLVSGLEKTLAGR